MSLTKIGDMSLTFSEARALRRLIAQHIDPADVEREQRERAESEDRATHIYERVRALAFDTARRDGHTTIPPYLQARAAWEAFVASEGYHDRYDVDERWQPSAHDAETWELAYTSELERMKDTSK
jgi:hypothetical protein